MWKCTALQLTHYHLQELPLIFQDQTNIITVFDLIPHKNEWSTIAIVIRHTFLMQNSDLADTFFVWLGYAKQKVHSFHLLWLCTSSHQVQTREASMQYPHTTYCVNILWKIDLASWHEYEIWTDSSGSQSDFFIHTSVLNFTCTWFCTLKFRIFFILTCCQLGSGVMWSIRFTPKVPF